MRIFKNSRNVIEKIAAEMMSFEAGKKLFDNGELLSAPYTLYPFIHEDGIETSIRGNIGTIYVSDTIRLSNFAKKLQIAVRRIETKLEEKGIHTLSDYSAIESGAEHFTVVKSKMEYPDETIVSGRRSDITYISKRRISWNPSVSTAKLASFCRFLWVIRPFSVMLDDMMKIPDDGYSPLGIDFVLFYSIVYDRENIISKKDNEWVELLKYDNFHICKNIAGPPQLSVNKRFAKTSFIASDAAPGYHELQSRLTQTWTSRQLHSIYCSGIYWMSWSEFRQLSQADKCRCGVPFYNDIYMIDRPGSYPAYCALCIHTNPSLYNPNDVLRRIKCPKTHIDIIQDIPCDDWIKDVLKALFKGIKRITPSIRYIGAEDKPEYIGVYQSLSNLIKTDLYKTDINRSLKIVSLT